MSVTPIRICIGTEPKTEIARKVLEYSILQNTKREVKFYPMMGTEWKTFDSKEHKLGMGTGFSLQRWQIPKFFNYEGAAIYLDADQLVVGDIHELWSKIPVDGCIACTFQHDKWFKTEKKPNTSVMVMDCEYCKNDPGWLDGDDLIKYLEGDVKRKRYVQVMHALHLQVTVEKLPVEWNHLNTYVEGKTKLIHYTQENIQPWYVPSHPFAAIWGQNLYRAVKSGYIALQELTEASERYRAGTCCTRADGLHPSWLRKFIV